MKALILVALAALVAGCSTLEQTGSYTYSVRPDGEVLIDSQSLRGGPTLEMETDGSGGIRVLVVPSDRRILEELAPYILGE